MPPHQTLFGRSLGSLPDIDAAGSVFGVANQEIDSAVVDVVTGVELLDVSSGNSQDEPRPIGHRRFDRANRCSVEEQNGH